MTRYVWMLFAAGILMAMEPAAASTWTTDFGGMPHYTGQITPQPQDANYRDDYLPLDRAALLLGRNVREDDPRLAVLRHRVEELGGTLTTVTDPAEAEAGQTVIAVGEVADVRPPRSAPAREQGYVIAHLERSDRPVIVLRGHDELGLLWAIVSLNQLMTERDGALAVQRADVYDFPVHTRRGYISGWAPQAVEDEVWYILHYKIDQVALRRFERRDGAWREPVSDTVRHAIERTGELLTPLGIEWHEGYRQVDRNPEHQLRISSDEDFNIILDHARLVAAAGGHFSVKFDDQRFPLHPDDKTRFGSAREADMYFLERLLDELREDHPHARLLFCPPFYWGPSSGHAYHESREAYLAAVGELPDAIEVFWTGPSVKSSRKTPEHVEWITRLLRRKPVVWQNRGWTPHVYNYHYHTDPVSVWEDWHYDGFFDEVRAYLLNTHMPASSAAVVTLVDYLWNPEGYDAEAAIEQIASKLTGPESYELMDQLNRRLSYFDRFGLRRTPAAARHLDDLKEAVAKLESTWQQVEQRFGDRVLRWTNMQRYPDQQKRFVSRLEQEQAFGFADEVAAVERTAAEEADFSDERDILLTATDFRGGQRPRAYAIRCEPRLATWIHGAASANPRMEARFEADPFPPAGDYTMIVSAQDDDRRAPARIRIRVNDTAIFEGENEFTRNGWSRRTFTVPGDVLERYNTLAIESLDDSANTQGPPWFMLNYALLRPSQ